MKKAPPTGCFFTSISAENRAFCKGKTCHSSDDVQKIVLNIRASEHQKQLQKLDDNYDDRGKSKKSSEAAQPSCYARQKQTPRQKQQQIAGEVYDKIFDNDRRLIRRRYENIKAEKRYDVAVCLNILGVGHVKRCADALEQRKIRQGRAVQGENDYQDGSFPLLISLPFGDRAAGEVHVFVEGAHAVDYAVVGDLDYAVCDGLRELVVVA